MSGSLLGRVHLLALTLLLFFVPIIYATERLDGLLVPRTGRQASIARSVGLAGRLLGARQTTTCPEEGEVICANTTVICCPEGTSCLLGGIRAGSPAATWCCPPQAKACSTVLNRPDCCGEGETCCPTGGCCTDGYNSCTEYGCLTPEELQAVREQEGESDAISIRFAGWSWSIPQSVAVVVWSSLVGVSIMAS